METRNRSGREHRRSRNKQPRHQVNDHQESLRARRTVVISGTHGDDRKEIADEEGNLQIPPVPGVFPPDGYVEKWLAQTTLELDPQSNLGFNSGKQIVSHPIGLDGKPRNSSLQSFFQLKEYGVNEERANVRHKGRKRVLESSDCSFLEPAVAAEPRAKFHEACRTGEGTMVQGRQELCRQRRKSATSISSGGRSSSISANPQAEAFKKRSRRKMREDRNEPNKALYTSKSQVKRKQKRDNRKTTKVRPKALRKFGEDVMNQFSSKNVGHDRLTMRPSRRIGLFKNGRASSPGRWRGLPDLTFSEMEFLRYSKQRPIEAEDKSRSKSRGRDKRKAEHVQEEISEYFRPRRSLRAEVEINKDTNRQQTRYTYEGSAQAERTKEGYQSSYSKSVRLSTASPIESFEVERSEQTLDQLTAMPHSRGQVVQPGVDPNISRKLSDRGTIYLTWSNTSSSRKTASSTISSTPGSIRQLLNNTGVFADTGINRTIGRRRDTDCNEPEVYGNPHGSYALAKCNPALSHPDTASHAGERIHRLVQAAEIMSKAHTSPHKSPLMDTSDNSRRQRDDRAVSHLPKTVVKHCSPGSGSQQDNGEGSVVQSHHSTAEAPKLCIPRQVINQTAYVKQARAAEAVALRVDNTGKATPTGGVEADIMNLRKQHTKQTMYAECNEEIEGQCLPLSGGVEKRGLSKLAPNPNESRSLTTAINIEHATQSPKSGLSAGSRQGTVPVGNEISSTPPSTHTAHCLPNTYSRAEFGVESMFGLEIARQCHEVAGEHVFEGLPVRGSWPCRTSGLHSIPHINPPPMVVEPLYHHQLGVGISYNLLDADYDQNQPEDLVSHQFDINSMKCLSNDGEDLFDSDGGKEELTNDMASLQDFEAILVGSEGPGVEENQRIEWDPSCRFTSQQTATQEAPYGVIQSADPLDEQQPPIMNPDFHQEAYYYPQPYDLTRSLRRAAEVEENHDFSGFWRPHRLY